MIIMIIIIIMLMMMIMMINNNDNNNNYYYCNSDNDAHNSLHLLHSVNIHNQVTNCPGRKYLHYRPNSGNHYEAV